jgi:hypothetical protein
LVLRTTEILSPSELPKDHVYTIVATYLPLRSFSYVIAFLRLSSKIDAQLRLSKGIVKYSLRTDIPRKLFCTLSVWMNRDDMALFSRSEPHRTAMKKFYDWGTDAAGIAEWTSPSPELDWAEAEKRLETPMFRYKLNSDKRLVHAPGSRTVASDKAGDDSTENS